MFAHEVRSRASLMQGGLAAETVLEQFEPHDVAMFVDEDSEEADRLRSFGVPVHISPHRHLELSETGSVSADHAMALECADIHRRHPFDRIFLETSVSTDPAWYVPELASVPLGVLPGAGIDGYASIVCRLPGFDGHGLRRLWACLGLLSGADFIADPIALSGTPIEAGVLDSGHENPVSGVRADARQVAVVALYEDLEGYTSLLERVSQTLGDCDHAAFFVIVPGLPEVHEAASAVIRAAHPQLTERVLIIPTGDDGSAFRLMRSADVVVAAGTRDARHPALERVPATRRVTLGPPPHDGSGALRGPGGPPASWGRVAPVPVSGPRGSLTELIDSVDADMYVLFESGAADLARRMVEYARLGRFDVAVVAPVDPLLGAPVADRVVPGVLAISRTVLNHVSPRLPELPALHELAAALICLPNASALSVAFLPDPMMRGGPLIESLAVDPIVLPTLGRGSGIPGSITVVGDRPGRQLSGGDDSDRIAEWVGSRRWSDRVRLALPWRFGLLERAMKGRW